MEVSCVCTFCQAMESMMHFQIETPHVNLNQNFRGLPRRLCLQRWSFCNFAFLGSEHVGHSWKRYFLRRCHLEAKMTKGRSGGYTCKSLRGHTGKTCVCVSLRGISFAWLRLSFLYLTRVVQQAGWWGWCTCRGIQLSFLTSGTSAPQSAAPLRMVQYEHGTSKMSVQRPQSANPVFSV